MFAAYVAGVISGACLIVTLAVLLVNVDTKRPQRARPAVDDSTKMFV